LNGSSNAFSISGYELYPAEKLTQLNLDGAQLLMFSHDAHAFKSDEDPDFRYMLLIHCRKLERGGQKMSATQSTEANRQKVMKLFPSDIYHSFRVAV
jgi:hypothetical protein